MKSIFRAAYFVQSSFVFLFLLAGLLFLHLNNRSIPYELDFFKILGTLAIIILFIAWYADYLHSIKEITLDENKITVRTIITNRIRCYKYNEIDSFNSKMVHSKVAKQTVTIAKYPEYLIIFNDGVEVKISPNVFSNYSALITCLRENNNKK